MQHWVRLSLGDAMLSVDAMSKVQLYLTEIYEQANMSEQMLALYRHESSGLHCSVALYLTTEFQHAALLNNAVKCHCPPLADSEFLAGNESYLHYLKRC